MSHAMQQVRLSTACFGLFSMQLFSYRWVFSSSRFTILTETPQYPLCRRLKTFSELAWLHWQKEDFLSFAVKDLSPTAVTCPKFAKGLGASVRFSAFSCLEIEGSHDKHVVLIKTRHPICTVGLCLLVFSIQYAFQTIVLCRSFTMALVNLTAVLCEVICVKMRN